MLPSLSIICTWHTCVIYCLRTVYLLRSTVCNFRSNIFVVTSNYCTALAYLALRHLPYFFSTYGTKIQTIRFPGHDVCIVEMSNSSKHTHNVWYRTRAELKVDGRSLLLYSSIWTRTQCSAFNKCSLWPPWPASTCSFLLYCRTMVFVTSFKLDKHYEKGYPRIVH